MPRLGRLIGESESMDRQEKKQAVSELRQIFEESTVIVVMHQNGLSVAESTDLRQQMRDNNALFKVTKNRLAKIAAKDTQYEGLADLFSGPTAIAYSVDPVAPAKIAKKYAEKSDGKLQILGGAMGANVLDVTAIKALADMPSLDELRAKIISVIQTPASRIAAVTNAPAAQLARVLNAYSQK